MTAYPVALVIYLLCLAAHPGQCVYEPAARVTEYVPAFGGINCEEPCNITASMLPVTYGLTAACGPNVPFGTLLYIESAGWRTCHDRGGAIDDDEVDVAVEPAQYFHLGINGRHPVVWIYPFSQEAQHDQN